MIASSQNNPHIVEELLAHGADASARDLHGKMAMDYAREAETKEILRKAAAKKASLQ